MADCVKTNIMKRLGELFATIPELKYVARFKGKPIDLDVTPLPALFFNDDEEKRERRNQVQWGNLTLMVTVFFKLSVGATPAEVFVDEADEMQAKIHNLLFGTNNLTGIGLVKVQEGTFHKEAPNDSVNALVMEFTLEYLHVFGDAFRLPQSP